MKSIGLLLCIIFTFALYAQGQTTIPPSRPQTFAMSRANYALWWYGAAIQAVRYNNTPGPLMSSRTFAIIGIAIHDTVNAFNPLYESYTTPGPVPPGANIEAAVAGAGYQTLARLYPNRIPDWVIVFRTQLALIRRRQGQTGVLSKAVRAGFAYGRSVADLIVNRRSTDNALGALFAPYTPPVGQGFWTPAPPLYGAPVGATWGQLPPFSLQTGNQFRPPGPPFAFQGTYQAAYLEIFDKGIYPGAGPTTRTALETYTAFFFLVELPGQYTPPGQYWDTSITIALDSGLSLADTARFMALVGITMMDCSIVAWDAKYFYGHWRPYTAVVNNTNTSLPANPNWFPLLQVTPPFPEYVSGHSTIGGGLTRMWNNWFNTDIFRYSARSETLPGVTAIYNSFSQFQTDNAYSRVFAGAHFRKSCFDAINSGIQVADWVYTHNLRPLF